MVENERKLQYLKFLKTIDYTDDYITVDDLTDVGFFTAPASAHYHGSYEGGLFDHSLETAKALVELTEKLGLTWERPESPYIVGMYHDLCKCNLYLPKALMRSNEPSVYTYNPDIIIPGHGEKSVIMIQKYMNLTDEEIACIRWHMGAFDDKTNWDYYCKAVEKYPNVLYTHTADMIASKIRGI
jgi:HD superfamily phosphohydrolase YqeK